MVGEYSMIKDGTDEKQKPIALWISPGSPQLKQSVRKALNKKMQRHFCLLMGDPAQSSTIEYGFIF
jgi:hypothetical protein